MNREWSELNKTMQMQLKKKDSFSDGVETCIILRSKLMEQIHSFLKVLTTEDFYAVPYKNAKGYHSKTIAYSLWHIFRIEDIVTNTLIAEKEQVFFTQNYQKRIGSPVSTTGNEITDEQLEGFSKRLNVEELYNYISEVDKATTEVIKELTYESLKRKVSDEKKQKLRKPNVVSEAEEAFWLIDYWCEKDIRGLIQMPLTRHWIMHVEACLRIRDKILTGK